jgi:hypothetical protein
MQKYVKRIHLKYSSSSVCLSIVSEKSNYQLSTPLRATNIQEQNVLRILNWLAERLNFKAVSCHQSDEKRSWRLDGSR